jgi:hypothetical protein
MSDEEGKPHAKKEHDPDVRRYELERARRESKGARNTLEAITKARRRRRET